MDRSETVIHAKYQIITLTLCDDYNILILTLSPAKAYE